MKAISMITLLALLLFSCGGPDPMVEINQLVAKGKVTQAKLKFKKYVEAEQNPNLTKEFIEFCFKHEQFADFRREVGSFLRDYPTDSDVINLRFDYYARLANDAERQKSYGQALEYIVNHLLDPEYTDHSMWEGRQITILQKWHAQAKEQGDLNKRKKILIDMKNLGFENMAKSLDPEMFEELEAQEGSAKKDE